MESKWITRCQIVYRQSFCGVVRLLVLLDKVLDSDQSHHGERGTMAIHLMRDPYANQGCITSGPVKCLL